MRDLFKCTNPECSFEAIIPDAPGDAMDAMRCPICENQAILVDPARPAFNCAACNRVFRASGSTRSSEKCSKCGGLAPRVGGSATSGGNQARAKLSDGEEKPITRHASDGIQLECPHCEKRLRVATSAAGKRIRCPKCSKLVVVPDVSPQSVAKTCRVPGSP